MLPDRESFIKQPHPIEFELRKLYSKSYPVVICDVGSCEGEDSIRFSKLFPYSSIFAFEPLQENVKLMRKHFNDHNIANVKIYNKAVSDKNEFLKFYVSCSNRDNFSSIYWNWGNKSSSILKPKKHLDIIDFIQFEKIINVDSITLLSFFDQESIEHIDILQIDVQGAELMVLKGLGDKIKNVYVVWVEVSKLELYKEQPLQIDIHSFMCASGFMLVKDTLYNFQGDHLYVSIDKFGYTKLLCLKLSVIFRDFYIRVINKLKRILFR